MKQLEFKLEESIDNTQKVLKKTSQSCDYNTIGLYNKLLTNNTSVKKIYCSGIDKILKKVFPDKYFGWNEYKKGDLPGIYDLEKHGRSVINKLNTNYSCLCILVNDVNKVLNYEGRPEIKIIGEDYDTQIEQTTQLINFIDEKKDRIFSPNSSTYQNIMSTLYRTDKSGDKTEDIVIEKLIEKFGKENVTKIGGLGSIKDATKGIDCEINSDDKIYTSQIKPFSYFEIVDGNITLFGVSGVKKYCIDWFIFHDNKRNETKIIKNNHTQIIDDNYVFPETNLIITI